MRSLGPLQVTLGPLHCPNYRSILLCKLCCCICLACSLRLLLFLLFLECLRDLLLNFALQGLAFSGFALLSFQSLDLVRC